MAATPAGGPPSAPLYVSIVSSNPATLHMLRAYLTEAGVASYGSDVIELAIVAPPRATTAVVFPDDFDDTEVISLVRHLRRTRPELLAVLVTRRPQRFETVLQADGRSVPPIVLPTSSFGWEILDAIRAHRPTASSGNAQNGG